MNTRPHPHEAVNQVHVIFKTHFDLGFTDLARRVVTRYFQEFIPSALETAQRLHDHGGDERFIWTTGSWLIFEYLEHADLPGRLAMERAIARGDIAWHALPFNTHSELMNAALFRHGLSLSARLDQRFGHKTIAAKMTDVPGHTRAIVPLLAEAGIRFLHIGVNPASTAPSVPDLFRWRHTDGSEVSVMYDGRDYGETSVVPAASAAIHFAHTRDNEGPPTLREVLETFARLREQFPAADVKASTLDEVAARVCAHANDFPVVTDELGDSWIHGAAADPARMTPYRALARLYQTWIDVEGSDPMQSDLDQFARYLMLVPEHTWGMMMERLDDTLQFEGSGFDALRATEAAQRIEASWDEQRAVVFQAIEALGHTQHRRAAEHAVELGQATEWSLHAHRETTSRHFEAANFELAIDETGAIIDLLDRTANRRWATPSHPLGRFVYESFSAADYERFWRQYVTLEADWTRLAFMKNGMDVSIEPQTWTPKLMGSWFTQDEAGLEVLLALALPAKAVARFGAPPRLQARWKFLRETPSVQLMVQWFGKRATRLPTAAWVTFSPQTQFAANWYLHKVGAWLSPDEVVRGGGRMLHGVESGVRYEGQDGQIRIESLDAAIVAPGQRSLLQFHQEPLQLEGGMHFCLWNNVWNTNFPLWHERDERFRFRLTFEVGRDSDPVQKHGKSVNK